MNNHTNGVTKKSSSKPASITTYSQVLSQKTGILNDIRIIGPLGFLKTHLEFAQLYVALKQNKPFDDRKYQIEHLLQMLIRMPITSSYGQMLSKLFIKSLWFGLSHPPASFSEEVFRTPDGTGQENIWDNLGQANSMYARSVLTTHLYPEGFNLPDPGKLFDKTMLRTKFKEHPSGISSMMFYFATLVIHEMFNTDIPRGLNKSDPMYKEKQKRAVNKTSSYVDFNILYGNNETELRTVRTGKDGKLYPDSFADNRLIFMVPGVISLLICFSRNHNYICDQLKKNNDDLQYSDDANEETVKHFDDKIFLIARYINCFWFAQIILHDYVKSILNINSEPTAWFLDLAQEIKISGEEVPRGSGNLNSMEFNFVYRWHSTMSQEDEEWFTKTVQKYSDKPVTSLGPDDFHPILVRWSKEQLGKHPLPRQWVFDGLERDENGEFDSFELGKRLAQGCEWIAGAFGSQNTPGVMRFFEMMGIEQGRNWNICTLNEFRNFIGCTAYNTFDEITKNKEVAKYLKSVYSTTDNVELYPGLVLEDAKTSQLASGLCPTYSASRAILFDAVALVRGDRLFSHGGSPATLTTWGFKDIQSDPTKSYGNVLWRLLDRTLRKNGEAYFPANSIYSHFGFNTPDTVYKHLKKFGVLDQYDFRSPLDIHGQR